MKREPLARFDARIDNRERELLGTDYRKHVAEFLAKKRRRYGIIRRVTRSD